MVNKKLFEAFKNIIQSKEHIYEEHDFGQNLKEGYIRYNYVFNLSNINEESKMIFQLFSTIKELHITFVVDTDINENGDIDHRQITLLILSGWENNYSSQYVSSDRTYFINDEEDFDFEKIKNHFNEYLNTLKYNNFTTIEQELKEFLLEVEEELRK